MSSFVLLKINFKTAGLVEGECDLAGFEGAIPCESMSWGMAAKDWFDSDAQPLRRTVKVANLQLAKLFDESSLRLYNAMKNRDVVVKASVSVVTQVGGKDTGRVVQEVVRMNFSDGLLEDVALNSSEEGESAVVTEGLRFRFSQMEMVYVKRQNDGSLSNVRKSFTSQHRDVLNSSRL